MDTLQAGDEREPLVGAPLTVTDFVRYQGASGDMNPLHHDPAFAERAGLPSVLAVGMLQAGTLATYVTDWLGAENVRRFSVRFKEPAWPGDVITYTGRVVAIREEGDERLVDIELLATRQSGGVHLSGRATFRAA